MLVFWRNWPVILLDELKGKEFSPSLNVVFGY